MMKKSFVPFKIRHLDSLGQGVSKEDGQVLFIPKTALDESGVARVVSKKKGVLFGRVETFTHKSEQRIRPACQHFNSCYSCHYLHLPYDQELEIKKQSFQQIFRNLPLPPVEVIGSEERLGYRNRIQLHYNIKKKLLGFLDPQSFNIVPVPNCLIALKEIQTELKKLYQNDYWIHLAPASPLEGHLEIYFKDQKINLIWNSSYAEGGFTQVHQSMNSKLKETLLSILNKSDIKDVLDLFAGDGNLTNDTHFNQRMCIDLYSDSENRKMDYFSLNLYDKEALSTVLKEVEKRELNLSHLILDPPRSGFKELNKWLGALGPRFVVYISCNPHTLARDLTGLTNYTFLKSVLLDFFPSTFHFETMLFLERK